MACGTRGSLHVTQFTCVTCLNVCSIIWAYAGLRGSVPVREPSLTAVIYMVFRAAGQQLPHGGEVLMHTL